MPKPISPWQALFRYFPNSMVDAESAVVRVRKVQGVRLPASTQLRDSLIREAIARRIDALEQRKSAHSANLAERAGRRGASSATVQESQGRPSNEQAAEYERGIFSGQDDDFSDLFSLPEAESAREDAAPAVLERENDVPVRVHPNQVTLYDIGQAQVDLEVYPLTFRCPVCGHFELANPSRGRVPTCSCCVTCSDCGKAMHHRVGSQPCTSCGSTRFNPTPLRQLSLVEVCSRCARVQPIFPYNLRKRPEEWVGKPIICPKCKDGHIHLQRGVSLNEARFVCTRGCKFERWETELGGACPECSVYRDKSNPDDSGNVAYLKPTPAVASSNLAPLVESFLFLGTEEATLKSLRKGAQDGLAARKPIWTLKALDTNALWDKAEAARMLWGIKDAFTLPDIVTTTVNYGCWSRLQEHRSPVTDDQRLHRFYRSDRDYEAYLVETQGHGLVIELDRDRLLRAVNQCTDQSYATYDELVQWTVVHLSDKASAQQISFQDLVDPDKVEQHPELALVRLLHSLEHAILSQAEEQVGLQVFGSKILIGDAAIVLFEQEDVGDGGIRQLVQGSGFLKLMRGVHTALETCDQGCEDACPACSYVEDAKCRPFVPQEFGKQGVRWIPPNALLSRRLAHHFLEETHG